MESKCLNCNIEIESNKSQPILWCTVQCKKDFYMKYFAGNNHVKIWERERDENFKESQSRVMEEIRESGLTASEFIRSLGDFKEDTKADKSEPLKKVWDNPHDEKWDKESNEEQIKRELDKDYEK